MNADSMAEEHNHSLQGWITIGRSRRGGGLPGPEHGQRRDVERDKRVLVELFGAVTNNEQPEPSLLSQALSWKPSAITRNTTQGTPKDSPLYPPLFLFLSTTSTEPCNSTPLAVDDGLVASSTRSSEQ